MNDAEDVPRHLICIFKRVPGVYVKIHSPRRISRNCNIQRWGPGWRGWVCIEACVDPAIMHVEEVHAICKPIAFPCQRRPNSTRLRRRELALIVTIQNRAAENASCLATAGDVGLETAQVPSYR